MGTHTWRRGAEPSRCRMHPQNRIHRRTQLKTGLHLPQPCAGNISAAFPHFLYCLKLNMQKKKMGYHSKEIKKKKKRPLWLQADAGSYGEAPCQEQRAKGSSVARRKGCGREGAVLNGPCHHHPIPPRLPGAALPSLAVQASKIHPAFKETRQFVPLPFGACQFVTDCRNP